LPFGDFGTFALDWYAGRANWLLTPPPVPPLRWFQTTSLVMVAPLPSSLVPPQASANGLDAESRRADGRRGRRVWQYRTSRRRLRSSRP
jgi:hypothetical protein